MLSLSLFPLLSLPLSLWAHSLQNRPAPVCVSWSVSWKASSMDPFLFVRTMALPCGVRTYHVLCCLSPTLSFTAPCLLTHHVLSSILEISLMTLLLEPPAVRYQSTPIPDHLGLNCMDYFSYVIHFLISVSSLVHAGRRRDLLMKCFGRKVILFCE